MVLANTSVCAAPSEMIAAVSLAEVRSKVKEPAVVNCPDGDTVTVRKGQVEQPCLNSQVLNDMV